MENVKQEPLVEFGAARIEIRLRRVPRPSQSSSQAVKKFKKPRGQEAKMPRSVERRARQAGRKKL